MATSGQTLNDRINAARYALAGQGLARCVCKATTEEVIGPKKKHLEYLIACTHEPNVSIPQLANLLIERTNHIYWVVVFKALVTVHHLMSYGNERFTQYLASSNYSFELSTFLDKTAARDFSMSTFIRRYSRYINEKALSYRLLAFDFCKVKRGNEGVLRLMPIDRLLKTLPILQNQLDALLEFDCSANDLNNGVINASFMLLFRDLIGLFACHNDGIINLLNKYFFLNRKMCREAFDLYKKFLVRMDKVSDFLRVAEVVGIDKDEIPDLRRAPSSLIDALEQHLLNIETNKKILKQQSTISGSSSNNNNSNTNNKTGGELGSVLGGLTPPSSRRPISPASGSSSAPANQSSSQSSTADEFSINSFKDEEVRKALEEEARVLSQYGSIDGFKPKSSGGSGKQRESSPKFAVSTLPKSIDDIFGDSDSFTNNSNNNNNERANSSSSKLNNNNCSSTSATTMAFDNLSNASSSSGTAKHNRPDMDSIKSAIKSATTTLENSKAASGSSASGERVKKASDDLFSLLDTSSLPATSQPTVAAQTSRPGTGAMAMSSAKTMSPFSANSSPFDLPNNDQVNSQPTLKPGNPFPEIGHDFAAPSAFTDAFAAIPTATPQLVATPTTIQHPNSTNQQQHSSVFKSTTQTTANYTNLGGLEGFGDLLQPMSASSKASSGPNANALGSAKPTFNPGTGLSSTGLFKGDLDSTLANLAQNLTFDGINKTKK